ncbi:hypothetical protein AB0K12_42200 [Nonomuraea sp. NPDC049419]|uniref:hypothetical protein n=1 Tax=Nonomuraea sp. NPDC049419 TaxID=3155772 RepID=UPI00341B277B
MAAIASVRAALADRLVTPWWYHPGFAALLGGCVLALGLGDVFVKIGGFLLLIACSALLARAYRRLTGVWVSGFEAGPAGRWLGMLGVLTGLTFVGALAAGAVTGLQWLVWCLAVIELAGTLVLCRRFDAELRAGLRAGA